MTHGFVLCSMVGMVWHRLGFLSPLVSLHLFQMLKVVNNCECTCVQVAVRVQPVVYDMCLRPRRRS